MWGRLRGIGEHENLGVGMGVEGDVGRIVKRGSGKMTNEE